MNEKINSTIMVTLLLISMRTFAFSVQPVGAESTSEMVTAHYYTKQEVEKKRSLVASVLFIETHAVNGQVVISPDPAEGLVGDLIEWHVNFDVISVLPFATHVSTSVAIDPNSGENPWGEPVSRESGMIPFDIHGWRWTPESTNTNGLFPHNVSIFYEIDPDIFMKLWEGSGTIILKRLIEVPTDYPTIQEAINNANEGDTIFVRNGTYYEHVVVNKTVSLIGENRSTTIIDGGGKGTVVYVTADNVIISGFTMQNSYGPFIPPNSGIHIDYSHNVTVRSNRVINNALGIYVDHSDGGSIIESNVSNNYYAIILRYSNGYTVGDNIASNNFYFGINLHHSSRSIVSNNNLSNNGIQGILLEATDDNIIYHNNFINNYYQVYSYGSVNTWDDGYPSGGNYWSDYTGIDEYSGPYQNETGSDGIGDIPYVIDANNQDNYPLVNPWTPIVHDVAVVDVLPSATEVYVGQAVNITVVVHNEGNVTESFTVTFKYELEGTEYIIGTVTVSDLPPCVNITLTFSWITTDLGIHTIKVQIPPIPGEINTANNIFIDGTVRIKMVGDVNGDNQVDIRDIAVAGRAFGSYPDHPRWNSQADVNQDGQVDIRDIALIATNFGKTY